MKNLCAIIVSYNGNERLTELIKVLNQETEEIRIVDNGSDPETILKLGTLEKEFSKVSVRYLNKNMGIAYALNQGLEYAEEQGYKWIITFDQDSIPISGAVEKLQSYAEKYYTESKHNVSFGPQLAITEDQHVIEKKAARGCRNVSYLITSGNLTLVAAAEKAGGWTDELFIDAVDYDFSLKLRSAGYRLWRCYDCVVMHQVGETNEKGVKNTHSSLRKYYMVRNHKYILKKYFFKFPGYCCFSTAFFAKGILRCFLREGNRRELLGIIKKALRADISEDFLKEQTRAD